MASTVVDQTLDDIFAGAQDDASRFLATLDAAITDAPAYFANIPGSPAAAAVVAAVLWAGRQADPNAAVDELAQQLGLVSIDPDTGAVTLLPPGKALLGSMDDEVKALVRSRLASFAEGRLRELLTQSKAPGGYRTLDAVCQ